MATNLSFLKSDKIKLRALEPEDLETLYRWENDADLWVFANAVSPYSKLALREYISNAVEYNAIEMEQLRLMVDMRDTGETIGIVDLYEINLRNSHAGIGVLIDEKYRKQGYASIALELMHNYVFSLLRLNQIYAHIAVNNKSSIALFEKLGYIKTGTLKDWALSMDGGFEDVQLMQFFNNNK